GDNVYLSGSFNNTINIGQGTILLPTPSTLIPNANAANSLFIKFSPTGSMLWYERSTASASDGLYNCSVDTSGTKIAVGGGAINGLTVFGYYINGNVGNKASVFFLFDTSTGNLISAVTGSQSIESEITPIYTDRDNNFICKGNLVGSVAYNSNT